MMTKEEALATRQCIDRLGLALANRNHAWSPEEREAYDKVSNYVDSVLKKHQQKS